MNEKEFVKQMLGERLKQDRARNAGGDYCTQGCTEENQTAIKLKLYESRD